jgi:uncharacterized membrane protein YgaE (UPF0421/DUF939 family)
MSHTLIAAIALVLGMVIGTVLGVLSVALCMIGANPVPDRREL